MNKNRKVWNAVRFAGVKHSGQQRKYTFEPYVTHPISVMKRVEEFLSDIPNERFPGDLRDDILAAAVLHDTVEDTDATIDEIETHFGERVACYVWYLTDSPKYVGNRRHRKSMDNIRLGHAPAEVRLIKVFDFMDNAPSIKEHDPKFFQQFMIEKLALFDVMSVEDFSYHGKSLNLEDTIYGV